MFCFAHPYINFASALAVHVHLPSKTLDFKTTLALPFPPDNTGRHIQQ